ncbi:hypothetical protein [Cloacibacillus sp. An23]|uniref:hypothetical protein n=1 Tax=Cloacibacillus sp. An23 TaxID=1965591 RepID=UPI000B36FD0C|nr:hypothetical protein [Cloacibacillus sp. An23]OUO94985.1 hypothetical protein B5F39_00165 [Cloacibacillus sp. An23]
METREYSAGIADAVKSFLEGEKWNFDFDEEKGVFTFGLNLDGKIKEAKYFITVDVDDYTVYARSPIGADKNDEKMMTTMADFVCRANYGLKNGNFEFDMRDGEIRYKSFVDCESMIPNQDVIRNSIYCPASMLERYGAGIVDIICINATAEDAIAKCED